VEWSDTGLKTELDEHCTLEDFRTKLSGKQLIIIREHGYYAYHNTPMILLDNIDVNVNILEAAALPIAALYNNDLADLYSKRIVSLIDAHGTRVFGLLPEFIEHYYRNSQMLSNSIVWVGCCYGYKNDALVSAFYSSGAKCVIGASESVNSDYGWAMCDAFVYQLLYGNTVDDSLNYAKQIFGKNDGEFIDTYYNISISKNKEEFKIYNNYGKDAKLVTLTEEAKEYLEKQNHPETSLNEIDAEEALFYQYIQNVAISELGLTELEIYKARNMTKGIVSAHINDYTGDGKKDMLLIAAEPSEYGISTILRLYSIPGDRVQLLSEYKSENTPTDFEVYFENNQLYIHDQYISEVFGMMGWGVSEEKITIQNDKLVLISNQHGSVGAPPSTDRTESAILLSSLESGGSSPSFNDKQYLLHDYTDLRSHIHSIETIQSSSSSTITTQTSVNPIMQETLTPNTSTTSKVTAVTTSTTASATTVPTKSASDYIKWNENGMFMINYSLLGLTYDQLNRVLGLNLNKPTAWKYWGKNLQWTQYDGLEYPSVIFMFQNGKCCMIYNDQKRSLSSELRRDILSKYGALEDVFIKEGNCYFSGYMEYYTETKEYYLRQQYASKSMEW